MAGTVVYTEETFGTIKKITAAWTATSGGAVSGNATTNTFSGAIERLVTVPGTAGNQPSDQYDLTVLDQDGTDVLMGAGANRSNASTEQVLASSLGIVANDTLTVTIAAAGDAKKGTVHLYIR